MKDFNRFAFVFFLVFLVVIGCKKPNKQYEAATTQEKAITTHAEMLMDSIGLIDTSARSTIPTKGLIAYYPLSPDASGGVGVDLARGNNGTWHGSASPRAMSKEEDPGYATRVSYGNYLEIPDRTYLSIAYKNQLTVSVWIKPEVSSFPNSPRCYAHFLGKGESGNYEWCFRIYDYAPVCPDYVDRPGHISCYAYNNATCYYGVGARVAERFEKNKWYHVVAMYKYDPAVTGRGYQYIRRTLLNSTQYISSRNSTWNYKNCWITPHNSAAPVRVGTTAKENWFQGVMQDLRIYDRVLSASEIAALSQERNNR